MTLKERLKQFDELGEEILKLDILKKLYPDLKEKTPSRLLVNKIAKEVTNINYLIQICEDLFQNFSSKVADAIYEVLDGKIKHFVEVVYVQTDEYASETEREYFEYFLDDYNFEFGQDFAKLLLQKLVFNETNKEIPLEELPAVSVVSLTDEYERLAS